MNIVFAITGMLGGGAEGVVATLTEQLAIRGHQITLITNLKGQAYEVSEHVNVVDVRKWEYDTYVGSFPLRIYKKIANRYLDYKNIRRIIKEEKPDVVISFLIAWLWQLILICKGRIPLICAERNAMDYLHGRNNYYTKHILYRMADVVQVMSRYDKAKVGDRYKKTVAMPNPLKIEPLSEGDFKELFPKRKNILACGRVNDQKGFDKLIQAFSHINNKFPDWGIDICGRYEDTDAYYLSLTKMIDEYGLQDKVNFLGFHKDVDKIMQAHSIFCLSSKHEGFPNVLTEAMACGMACISFDIVTGPSEIIIDGLDGLIVENQNIKALAEGLLRLISNQELRYSLGLRATEDVKRFKRDIIVDKWEVFFEQTIANYHINS